MKHAFVVAAGVVIFGCKSKGHTVLRSCSALTNSSGDFPESLSFEDDGTVVMRFWTSPDVSTEITGRQIENVIAEDGAGRRFPLIELHPGLRMESGAARGQHVDYSCTN